MLIKQITKLSYMDNLQIIFEICSKTSKILIFSQHTKKAFGKVEGGPVGLGHSWAASPLGPKPKETFLFVLPFRCLGIADWQSNSVPGPLGTPPTVMFTAHFTISHITEFCSILRGGGNVLKYESPIRDSIRIKCKLCLFLP